MKHIPLEVTLAVEEWAGKAGRRGWVKWHPMMNCFAVHLSLSPDHPEMALWRDGKLEQADPPTESIPLYEQDEKTGKSVPLDLEEYGGAGITALLEKWDTWSGTGEYESPVHLVLSQIQNNRRAREDLRKQAEEAGQETAWLTRRKAFELPMVSVGANLVSS